MRKGKTIFIFLLASVVWPGCKEKTGTIKTTGKGGETIYRSGAAPRTPLQLPDGTELLLDSASVVRLPAGFNRSNRELFLEGAALFTVHSHGVKPFVVHTPALVTTVMDSSAASFKVSGYPQSPGEEVDLFAGNLKVVKSYHSDTDNEPLILRGGEMAMVNTDIDLMEKEKLDSAEQKPGILF